MQDSFGNPIPDPTADAAPETDAPVVDTPTETPVDSTPVESTPAFDTTPADPAPAADSTPILNSTPTADPAPAAAPSSVIAPNGGEHKSHTGLIIGIIIAVLVIGIIAAVAVIMMNHKDDGKKDDTTSAETKDKEEKKEEKKKDDTKDTKTTTKSIPIKYGGKDISISLSFGDTVKSFSKATTLYQAVEFEDVKIEDVDEFLKTTVKNEDENIRVNILDEEEYGIFEINGSAYGAKVDKDTYNDIEIATIYFWPSESDTITIDGHDITTDKTTEEEVKKMLGTPDDVYDGGSTYTLDYKINGIMVTIFFEENDEGVNTVDFITFN